MSKRKKPSKKRPAPTKNGAPAPDSAVDASESGIADMYDGALDYLRRQIKAVIDGTAPETKHDPAYRVASLMRMMAQVDAERRKARTAEAKRLQKLSRSTVMAWFRQLDPDDLSSALREIAEMTKEGSVLA